MTASTAPTTPTAVDPLPANMPSIQPGGGTCYAIELAWGRCRRWFLRTFRPGYVKRMAELRVGDPAGCGQEILDPRDLKFFRNQTDCHWRPEDDPFRWREKIPLARWGLAEVQLMGWPLLVATIALGFTWWYAAPITGALFLLVVSFFRDPPRRIPQEPGLLVAPADGKVVEIKELEDHKFVGGPAVRIAIFLTLFNVHVNRMPCRARVVRLRYAPGLFLHADHADATFKNENTWIGLEEVESPHRRMVCRQVSGMVARNIVCDLRPGEVLERGDKFGMIKFGSRTELIVPAEGLQVKVRVGQWIKAGRDVLAQYADDRSSAEKGSQV